MTIIAFILILALLVLVHEFGHVLGLEHDDYVKSIMYPVLPSRLGRASYSDYDREIIQDLYCQ